MYVHGSTSEAPVGADLLLEDLDAHLDALVADQRVRATDHCPNIGGVVATERADRQSAAELRLSKRIRHIASRRSEVTEHLRPGRGDPR